MSECLFVPCFDFEGDMFGLTPAANELLEDIKRFTYSVLSMLADVEINNKRNCCVPLQKQTDSRQIQFINTFWGPFLSHHILLYE